MRRALAFVLLLGCSSGDSTVASESDAEVSEDTGATSTDTGAPTEDAPIVEDSGTAPEDVATSDAPAEAAVDAPSETKSVGCASGKELPEGAATFTVGGASRKYTLRKPTGYTRDKVWPLVLALHPNGSNMGYYDVTTGGRAIRPLVKDKAILVLAEARTGGDWRGDLPTELAYFEALITAIKKDMCVDTSRIFSMGFSGGGSFSGVLGCSRTDIRAIASGGAVIYFDKAKCVGKPAAWITIGDDEAVAGRIEFRDFWRTRNECSTMTTVVPPAATCVQYGCPHPERPTQFCSHAGGHEWPSFGAQAAWGFFSKF